MGSLYFYSLQALMSNFRTDTSRSVISDRLDQTTLPLVFRQAQEYQQRGDVRARNVAAA